MDQEAFSEEQLDALKWGTIEGCVPDGCDIPVQISFEHEQAFMVLRTANLSGLCFSREEATSLLRLMIERLPLDAMGEI